MVAAADVRVLKAEGERPPKHKYIETPEKLWELFEAYVLHEQKHPMYKTEYVGKDGYMVLTP